MSRVWRRIGPWLTPAFLVAELTALCLGAISFRQAAVVFVVLEALLATAALANLVAAGREYRAGRNAGVDRWAALETGMVRLMPRRVARALLVEGKLWAALAGCVTRQRPVIAGPTFSYRKSVQPIFVMVFALLAVEGAVVEIVLAAVLGRSVWTWMVLAVHLYALVWVGGFIASLHTKPHTISGRALVLRDSVFTELTIPLDAVVGVKPVREDGVGRTGYAVDPRTRTAVMAYGGANLQLTLSPGTEIRRDATMTECVDSIRFTADDPSAVVAVLATRTSNCD